MQNLNALAVVCLKGFDWNDIRRPKPAAPKSLLASAFRAYKRLLDPHGLRLLIIVFALLLAFIMVIILAALEDQFAAIKMFIYGDGYYYSYTWRYARTAHSRDGFTPVTAPNGTILGYTAAILGPGRPADELQRCHALLLPFADLLFAPNRTAAGLWALVNATAPDLRWVFSFCLAWEYAPLCAGLLEADAAYEAAGPAAAADGLRGLYVPQCNVTGYAGSDGPPVSLDDWRALSAPPDEIVDAAAAALAPRRVEPALDLALWMTTFQARHAPRARSRRRLRAKRDARVARVRHNAGSRRWRRRRPSRSLARRT